MVFRILSGNLLTAGHTAGSVYVHAGTHLPGVGTSEDAQSPHLSLRLDGPKASARRSLTSKHRFAKSVVHWTGESSPERGCTALVFSLFRNDGRVGYSLGQGLLCQVLGETSNFASTVTPSGMVVGRAGRRRNQRPIIDDRVSSDREVAGHSSCYTERGRARAKDSTCAWIVRPNAISPLHRSPPPEAH